MSYILDALKRADADRERGRLPGLHSQPLGAVANPSGGRDPHAPRLEGGRRPARVAPVLALGLLFLVALAAGAWWWRTAAEIPSPPPEAEAPALEPKSAQVSPPADPDAGDRLPAPLPPAVSDDPPAAAAPASPVLPILAPPEPPPAPVATAPVPDRAVPPPPPTLPAAERTARPPSSAPAAPPAAPRRFADLPPETRAQLPPVSVSGSTYSQNPAHRMLIANGQVVQEGGELAPGLTLESIGPNSAVLNHRGLRYSIGY
jgi:general secretion pathway protein B